MKKIVLILVFFGVSLFAFEAINQENFDEKVSGQNTMVKFTATWCPSCRVLEKNLVQLDTKKLGVSIYEVDIDKQMSLALKYKVNAIPTLVYFKNGKITATEVGVSSVEELKGSIAQNL